SFTLDCLPRVPGRWLDVSSPRLLSLYLGNTMPQMRLELLNPDRTDLDETIATAAQLGLTTLTARSGGVDSLSKCREAYDCIWSISVVEHIAGEYDDTQAMKWLYGALKPGGRL